MLKTTISCSTTLAVKPALPVSITHPVITYFLLAVAAFLAACDSSPKNQTVIVSGQTMGTQYRVALVAEQAVDSVALKILLEDQLAEINRQMSTYRDDSEISAFNNSASTDWFRVSPELALVSQRALDIYHKTNGAFDASIGPLVNLWSFGPAQRPLTTPSPTELAARSRDVGSDMLEVRLDPPGLKKLTPGLQLDLSAIAKGYAVDRLATWLIESGYNRLLVDIGGELRAMGTNQDGRPWQVGIEKPEPSLQRSVQQVIALGDKSIATSGSYRNYFEDQDKRFSHIINPATGYPINHNLVSVSVIADDCMSADAWATALMVMGPDMGFDYALQSGLAVYMIVKRGEEIDILSSPRMHGYLE